MNVDSASNSYNREHGEKGTWGDGNVTARARRYSLLHSNIRLSNNSYASAPVVWIINSLKNDSVHYPLRSWTRPRGHYCGRNSLTNQEREACSSCRANEKGLMLLQLFWNLVCWIDRAHQTAVCLCCSLQQNKLPYRRNKLSKMHKQFVLF